MSAKYSIILVEDHKPTAKEFTDYFAQSPDFEIIAVLEGETLAWDLILRKPPSVLIVDLALADGDGLPLIRDVLSDKYLPFRPYTIAITAVPTKAVRDTVLKLGADCLFGKENPNFSPELIADHLDGKKDILPLGQVLA